MRVNRLCGVSPRVAIIGVFDGVHRGHQALIEQARSLAGAGEVVALTFDPHPLTVVNPDAAPLMLGGIDDRIEQLTAAGVDEVVVQVDAWDRGRHRAGRDEHVLGLDGVNQLEKL